MRNARRWALLVGLGCVAVGGLVLKHRAPDSDARSETTEIAPSDVISTGSTAIGAARQVPAPDGGDAGPALPLLRALVTYHQEGAVGATVTFGTSEVVTDEAGRAAFEDCTPPPSREGEPKRALILGARKGVLIARTMELDCAQLPTDEVVLDLIPGASIHGLVRRALNHSPIEGARVSLEPAAGGVAYTDHLGAFSLSGVPHGTYAVVARARAMLPARLGAIRLPPGADPDLLLEMVVEGFVQGRVVDPAGGPVPDEQVSARAVGGATAGSTRTASDGSFFLGGLQPGRVVLTVEPSAFARLERTVPVSSNDAELKLSRGGQVAGIVRLNDDVVPGALVTLHAVEQTGAADRSAVTATDGGFALNLVEPGKYLVAATKTGLSESTEGIQVKEGATTSVEFRLTPQDDVVAGVVLREEDGAPLAGATVTGNAQPSFWYDATRIRHPDVVAMTDQLGHFSLNGFWYGEKVLVEAKAAGFFGSSDKVTAPDKGVVLRLRRPGRIIGRVIDSEGTPLHAFKVAGESLASGDGRFRVEWGCPSDPRFTVGAFGFYPEDRRACCHPNEVVDLGDIRLQDAIPSVIRVVSPEGTPIPGATIHHVQSSRRVFLIDGQPVVRDLNSDTSVSTTDANGEAATIDSVGCCVVATHPQYAPSLPRDSAPYGSGARVLTLQHAAWLAGLVLRAGVPVIGATVLDLDEGATCITGPDGSYRLGPLSAGAHHLVVGTDASAASAIAAAVTAGTEKRLDIQLP